MLLCLNDQVYKMYVESHCTKETAEKDIKPKKMYALTFEFFQNVIQ